MINIQRNFYVDNIIKQIPKINLPQIKKLPYLENIAYFENDNKINIYFLDVDKYKSLKAFKSSLRKIYENKKITFLIPISNVSFIGSIPAIIHLLPVETFKSESSIFQYLENISHLPLGAVYENSIP